MRRAKRKSRRNRRRYSSRRRVRRNFGVATAIINDGGNVIIAYHNTPVVKFNDKTITLNTGGYKTRTTMKRMNQAAEKFGLAYRVWIERGQVYVRHKGEVTKFSGNTVTLHR